MLCFHGPSGCGSMMRASKARSYAGGSEQLMELGNNFDFTS